MDLMSWLLNINRSACQCMFVCACACVSTCVRMCVRERGLWRSASLVDTFKQYLNKICSQCVCVCVLVYVCVCLCVCVCGLCKWPYVYGMNSCHSLRHQKSSRSQVILDDFLIFRKLMKRKEKWQMTSKKWWLWFAIVLKSNIN